MATSITNKLYTEAHNIKISWNALVGRRLSQLPHFLSSFSNRFFSFRSFVWIQIPLCCFFSFSLAKLAASFRKNICFPCYLNVGSQNTKKKIEIETFKYQIFSSITVRISPVAPVIIIFNLFLWFRFMCCCYY